MYMAVSSLLPRKKADSRSRMQTLSDRLDYDLKEEKTGGGVFVSSYMCCPDTAAEEFEAGRLVYEAATGRSLPPEKDIIAYRILQSFKPGEVTPEEANKLGYELAMEFTKGQHQFVVSTHIDKAHIHTHIEFNSTNLDCDGKFKNFKNSAFALRKLNDRICMEHGYSVIENPKAKGQCYREKAAAKRGRSFKERLRQDIDRILPGCREFEEFLASMRAEGYEIKRRGKSLEFCAPGQERFTRSYRLGDAYTETALRERIAGIFTEVYKKAGHKDGGEREAGSRKHQIGEETGQNDREAGQTDSRAGQTDRKKGQGDNFKCQNGSSKRRSSGRNVSLLVDIQAKMQAGKGKDYEQWAKVFNLKEAAKTLNFLTEHGVDDYEDLSARAKAAGKKFDLLSARMKQLEGRMAQTAQMKIHIINYTKTRDIYRQYQRLHYSGEYRALHEEEIKKCEAAKAAFDALGNQTVPKVKELSAQYAALLAEKRNCYEEYKAVRKEMVGFQTAKQNVDRILGLEQLQQKREGQKKFR